MESPITREELENRISRNESISTANTSLIDDMSGLFDGNDNFNQPLNEWDVSNVTNMERMFHIATSFNQPLNDWDVSNVKNMNNMFCNARSFNQPLNDWKLNSKCLNFGLLQNCYLWHLFNTEEDMPVKYDTRLEFNNEVKRKWKIL